MIREKRLESKSLPSKGLKISCAAVVRIRFISELMSLFEVLFSRLTER